MLRRFLGRCILSDLFFKKNSAGSCSGRKNGSCSGRKNGSCSGRVCTQGFIKVLMTDVERQEGKACKNFGGLAEIQRARGAMEAGAFGQRGKWGRL